MILQLIDCGSGKQVTRVATTEEVARETAIREEAQAIQAQIQEADAQRVAAIETIAERAQEDPAFAALATILGVST